jgi:glycosyltransferase involved in cell wall biosynthesis
MKAASSIAKAAIREYLTCDALALRALAGRTLGATAWMLKTAGRKPAAFRLLMKAHSAALSERLDRTVEREICAATARERSGHDTGLWALYDRVIQDSAKTFRATPDQRTSKLLGSRIIVVKTSRPRERGVLIVDYNYVLPLLAGLFDLQAITDRYFVVLEPGWSGYCTPEILLFSRLSVPVFAQAYEPRDRDLLKAIGQPFHVIFPASNNWWVDYRLAKPRPREERDIDVVMVAAWAGYKRHWRFFRAIAELRRRGRRLNVALIGTPYERSREHVLAEARHYGVDDQITVFEKIPPQQVFDVLSRARVHVLWSRREGSPRAVIEAMLADVPTILREGFNYGYHYDYMNPRTGRFAKESELADAILDVLDRGSSFSPRAWVLEHMTPIHATANLEQVIRAQALALGEEWTESLVPKTTGLGRQAYWDPGDRDRFAGDYQFLESVVKP